MFFSHVAQNAQVVLLTVLPHGGQGRARRNAWAAMSSDVVHSRARREAEAAMAQARQRSAHQSARAL